MLVDALRESQTPTDEDVIYGILGALLVSPVISVQAEKKKYHELLRDNGYVSVPALQRLTAEKLVAMGVTMGHADLVLAALFVQDDNGAPAEGGSSAERAPRSVAKLGNFPGLGVTNYPTASAFRLYKPKLTAHMRHYVSGGYMRRMLAVLKNPKDLLQAGHDPNGADNRALFNELFNSGDGMPDALQEQLPVGAVEQGHGLEVLQWISARVEAPSDQAAAKVSEWLTEPPVVSEAKRWMLSSVLAQWRTQLKRAADLGAALSAVQQRLSLQKVIARLPEALREWSTEKSKARPAAPAVGDLLVMLDELAEQYVSEKEAQVESNRLTMLLAGDTGSPAEDTRRDNGKKKKSKAPCWAWARGKCSRGEACRFTHYGEAGSGQKGPEGDQSAAQCSSVSDSAVSSGKLSGRVSYLDVAKGIVAVNASLTGLESASRVEAESDRVTAVDALVDSESTPRLRRLRVVR